MITRDTVVVGRSIADLTLEQFSAILESGSSPALVESEACYKAITSQGVSPAFCLAVYWQESALGTVGLAVPNKNPGNTRSSQTGIGMVVETVKGKFIKYPNWKSGFQDLAWRLVKPTYVYAQEGRRTIEQIIRRWAPPEDGNDTEGYIQSVIESMNKWLGNSEVAPKMEIIDLSDSTPDSVYTDRGMPISEVILHDTAGSNDNNQASPSVCQITLNATIRWFQGPGGVSIHYLIGPENLGAKIYRLCKEQFAAYHAVGNKGSINGVSKDNRISIGIERFGQPNEAVGPNQRAAMLWLVKDITDRYGLPPGAVISHMSIQSDRRDGNVLLAASRAVVGGLNHVTNEQPTKPAVDSSMLINGHVLAHGMLDYWNKVAVPGVQHPLGLPLSEEQDWTSPDGKKLVIQVFERGVLGYDASIADPAYRVQGLLIGASWAKEHGIAV
jgi:hypothetical protein